MWFRDIEAGFKKEQLRYRRVRQAYAEKEQFIRERLLEKNIKSLSIDLYLRAFKKERVLEVWVKEKKKNQFILFIDYKFCSSSGELGPKRKQGDYQIPEGYYYINRFNPYSKFYLSFGLNYPNESDRILGYKSNLGGDIFIHGDCVTIGCIPITDDKIKELYIIAVEARSSGQKKIPVHIFPTRLNEDNFNNLKIRYSSKTGLVKFWECLKPAYDYFEKNKKIPSFIVDRKGKYILKE